MVVVLGFNSGCGESNTAPQPAVIVEDPVGEFEWGMTRLERALRLFRPSAVGGLSISEREMTHELIPPNDKNSNYTALVTIVSKASFLHGKRLKKKKETSEASKNESKIDDPLSEQDDYSKFIDIPGTGSRPVDTPKLETRSLDSTTVFELAYLEGHWKLTKQPEKKHEQIWFEYAFD